MQRLLAVAGGLERAWALAEKVLAGLLVGGLSWALALVVAHRREREAEYRRLVKTVDLLAAYCLSDFDEHRQSELRDSTAALLFNPDSLVERTGAIKARREDAARQLWETVRPRRLPGLRDTQRIRLQDVFRDEDLTDEERRT